MRKKVLFVTNTMGRAGAERVLTTLFTMLDMDRLDIDFLSLIGRGEMFLDIPDTVHVLNKKPIPKSVMDKSGYAHIVRRALAQILKPNYFFKFLRYARRNLKLQRARNRVLYDKLLWEAISDGAPRLDTEYDLAVAYLEGAATYYVCNHVKAKTKIGFVHVDYESAGYMRALDERYYAQLDRIFCVSENVREGFLRIYPEFASKTGVFHNVVSAPLIERGAKAGPGFEDGYDGKRLVTMGRLHYQKGYDVAIEACALLRDRGYEFRWYVIGEGAERQNLEKLIAQHNLQGRFVLMGAQQNPYPFIAQCDIYVHASRFEGWCIAVAEAMTLCRPIMASDFTGIREQIVDGQTGLIVPMDPASVADGIARLLDNPALCEAFTEALRDNRFTNNEIDLLYELAGA